MKLMVLVTGLLFLTGRTIAQQSPIQFFRPYDKRGINVYETSKQDTVAYDGFKLRLGGNFTQGWQNLGHSNNTNVAANKLYDLAAGFPLAQANFNMDVQITDGVRLNLVSYMSSHHHNEFWVKGGYFQIDKVGFLKSDFFNKLWKNMTMKVGHMEINYGDQHFRRSDGGNTLWNPFIENYIMDEFTTEIGAELYWQKNGIVSMIALTDGEIQGNVLGANGARKPSLYGKLGYDKQINDDLRIRLTGSFYTTKSSVSNTLFGGDRTGSNYYFAMEPTTATLTANAFSGRFNPGYRDNVTTFMVNPFVKYAGFEFFGTYESAKGNSAIENGEGTNLAKRDPRKTTQIAADLLYRFGSSEQFYVGARYNQVKSTIAYGIGAATQGTLTDVTISRTAIGAGWFLTRNVLFKGEYVSQKYEGYPANDRLAEGKFSGWVVQGIIGF